MPSLEQRLKLEARRLGFDLVGIAPAVTPPSYERLRAWLDAGHAGEMTYLERHCAARAHPEAVLPKVRTVVMAAMNYRVQGGARPDRDTSTTDEYATSP